MRLLIAMMKHETNTFSPVPTPLARFGHGPGPLYGDAAVQAYRGTGSGLGAYLDLAKREKAEIVLPIAAGAPPSRPVEDAAFEHMAGVICEAVKKGGYDGMFLDLHGAMVTESLEDGEGELLRRIRAIDPTTPIAVALDMHANLYDAIIDYATVVTGYRTYPHIDTYDTAKRAGEILLAAMRGAVRPVMAWGNVPMLPHVMRQGLGNVAAFAIYDPEAVQQAIAAGIGAQITLSVGGKLSMPAIPGDSPPLTVTGTVKTISNGRFRNQGPMGRGVLTDMGPSVVIDTGKVEIVLISRHVEPSDLNCFYALAIDPMQKRFLMLKSRVHWRAGLGNVAKAVVDCAGMGVCTSDYSQLSFTKVRRPIYPLDLPNR